MLAGDTNVNAMEHMQKYYRRWKSKTIFQVLLRYRAARQQDLVYFSQQVSYHYRASKMLTAALLYS